MAITASANRYYKMRSKGSMCSGKLGKACRKIKSCRMTRNTAKRAHFCRKKTNTRRKR